MGRAAQLKRLKQLRKTAADNTVDQSTRNRAAADVVALKKTMMELPPPSIFQNVAFMKWRKEHSLREYDERAAALAAGLIPDNFMNSDDEDDDDSDNEGNGNGNGNGEGKQIDALVAKNKQLLMATKQRVKKIPRKSNMHNSVKFVKAASECDIVTMRALLKTGVVVNCVDPLTGRAALHEASAEGHEKALRLLFEREVDTNARTILGRESALHLAASNGHHRACRLLLRRGCEVDNFNGAGEAPIHHAGTIEVVNVLIHYGASPSMPNANGLTAMETIEYPEVVECIEAALEEEYRKNFARQKQKRVLFEEAQKAIWETEKQKQLDDDKRRAKREYMAFRHAGSTKRKTKSVFSDAADDGLFDYERRNGLKDYVFLNKKKETEEAQTATHGSSLRAF